MKGNNRLPVLAAQIVRAHQEAQQASETSIEKAIEAGEALIEAKEQVKHGEWLPWLKANCPDMSQRTVQRYMRIAKNKDTLAKTTRVSDLSLRGAIDALVPPTALDEHADRINELSEQMLNNASELGCLMAETRAHFGSDADFREFVAVKSTFTQAFISRIPELLASGDAASWNDALLNDFMERLGIDADGATD